MFSLALQLKSLLRSLLDVFLQVQTYNIYQIFHIHMDDHMSIYIHKVIQLEPKVEKHLVLSLNA